MFAKSRNSIVHVVNPIQGEHTLCGDAFDIDIGGAEAAAWTDVNRGPVTCTLCAQIIIACRSVRIGKNINLTN